MVKIMYYAPWRWWILALLSWNMIKKNVNSVHSGSQMTSVSVMTNETVTIQWKAVTNLLSEIQVLTSFLATQCIRKACTTMQSTTMKWIGMEFGTHIGSIQRMNSNDATHFLSEMSQQLFPIKFGAVKFQIFFRIIYLLPFSLLPKYADLFLLQWNKLTHTKLHFYI